MDAGDPPTDDANKPAANGADPQQPTGAQRAASETLKTILTVVLTTTAVSSVNHLNETATLLLDGSGVAALLIVYNPGDIRRRVRRSWHLPKPRPRLRAWRSHRQRRAATAPAGEDAEFSGPVSAHRWPAAGVVAGVVATATAVTFLLGYWVIGKGFAHGLLAGMYGLLGVLFAAALTLAWSRHRRAPGWLSWLRPWRNCMLALGVLAIGLSAGGAVGNGGVRSGPVQCPAPTELRVLAATEILGPLQAAISEFEQDEGTVCYAIDITAYAAVDDNTADGGIAADGWNLADGPRPDIWIPASTEELPTGASGPGQPALDTFRSIASSPIVIAVPASLVTSALRASTRGESMASLYQTVSDDLRQTVGAHFTPQVPNPRLSESAKLGIADLTAQEQAQIGESASFPLDSDSLLCQATPATPTAYLVSAVAVIANNNGGLASACPSQPAAQQRLTPLYPVGGSVLNFPFTTVTWPGLPVSADRATDEGDFFHWLTSPAGQAALQRNGLGRAAVKKARLPTKTAVNNAVNVFNLNQSSARILIAIDDSTPMQQYLGQITQALDSVLGPRAQGGNLSGRDSFGIWAFPGPGLETDQQPVPLAPNTRAQRARVQDAVAAITAHDHSAEFDLVWNAAWALSRPAPPPSASSIVLLTDGDSRQNDPRGNSIGTITSLLGELTPGNSPIKLYIIGFGPAGCKETPSGQPSDNLYALAKAGGGRCANEESGSLQTQLAQIISMLSTGG